MSGTLAERQDVELEINSIWLLVRIQCGALPSFSSLPVLCFFESSQVSFAQEKQNHSLHFIWWNVSISSVALHFLGVHSTRWKRASIVGSLHSQAYMYHNVLPNPSSRSSLTLVHLFDLLYSHEMFALSNSEAIILFFSMLKIFLQIL